MTNRIIKFRAWNGKEMIHGTDDQVSLVNALKLMEMPSELKWMQFTGLHDKNGKEIYEGDVTRINILDVGWVNCVVKHLEESGGYRHHKINQMQAVKACPGEGWSMLISDMFEVIGNIYENPELIK